MGYCAPVFDKKFGGAPPGAAVGLYALRAPSRFKGVSAIRSRSLARERQDSNSDHKLDPRTEAVQVITIFNLCSLRSPCAN